MLEITVILFFLGLLLGSFANVVIHRLPQGKSVITPRSSCPKCSYMIPWYDNIPVLSWLFLKAKCRSCKARISFRYPLVELLTGFLFVAIYFKSGMSWYTLEILIFSYALIIASFIDLDLMILPDSLTLSGIVIGLVGGFLNPERAFMASFLGVLLGGGFLYLTAYLYWFFRKKEGLGGGDIKLLAWIGAVLGWKSFSFVVLTSSFMGLIIGGSILFFKTSGLKSYIPFGPYLAVSALMYFFFGEFLVDLYLKTFFII